VALVSREGEQVDLVKNIFPHEHRGNVEIWLKELETEMKVAVHQITVDSFNDY